MFKVSVKSLAAHKIRLLMTTFAVVLGVTFVVASFVLSDSLRATFDTLSETITSPFDAQVRGVETFEGDFTSRPPVPQSVLDRIRSLPEVDGAVGIVQIPVQAAKPDGTLIDSGPAPTLGFGYDQSQARLSAFKFVKGEPPGPDQVAVDRATAEKYDLEPGSPLDVRGPGGSASLTVSGWVTFGTDNGTGAIYLLFDTDTAARLADRVGEYDAVTVKAADGVSPAQLVTSLEAAIPNGFEAVTADQFAREFSDNFGQIIDIFRNALLAFALVALFVSAFIINNTFSIVLGQRVRELALLRAIGALGSQITRSVLLEAAAIGLVASGIGVGMGVLGAVGLKALISGAGGGGGLPDGPLLVHPRTWIIAFGVGTLITLIAALSPARKAAAIPPVAAMRTDINLQSGGIRRRTIFGVITGVIGLLLLFRGVTTDGGAAQQLVSLGIGALTLFIAVASLSPLVARPVALALGSPLPLLMGTPGQLARQNAARSPRRTASTASALMIGMALVSMVLVVGTSFKKSFTDVLDQSVTADFFVSTDGQRGFTPQVISDLQNLPEIDRAGGFRFGQMRVAGDLKSVTSTPAGILGPIVNLDLAEGSYSDLGPDSVLIHRDPARDLGLGVGDTVEAEFPDGRTVSLRVAGVFDDGSLLGNWVIDERLFEMHFPPSLQLDVFGGATIAPGVDPEEAAAAVRTVAARYPEVKIEDRAEFKKSQEAQIDQALVTVNALLGLAIVIAVLGIANTMALSVFERTRELGLLRAVGMTSRQVRRMIRWEAAVVALFGAVLGTAIGVVFGFVAISAMPDSVISSVGVPIRTLVIFLVLAGVVGILAAAVPAWRAGRMNVLEAISAD